MECIGNLEAWWEVRRVKGSAPQHKRDFAIRSSPLIL